MREAKATPGGIALPERRGDQGGRFQALLSVVMIYASGYGALEAIRSISPKLALIVSTGATITVLGGTVFVAVTLVGDCIRARGRR